MIKHEVWDCSTPIFACYKKLSIHLTNHMWPSHGFNLVSLKISSIKHCQTFWLKVTEVIKRDLLEVKLFLLQWFHSFQRIKSIVKFLIHAKHSDQVKSINMHMFFCRKCLLGSLLTGSTVTNDNLFLWV